VYTVDHLGILVGGPLCTLDMSQTQPSGAWSSAAAARALRRSEALRIFLIVCIL
jgi:hypothetical protein